MSNSKIQLFYFGVDNQAVVQVVKSQTSRNARDMQLVRSLVLMCLQLNVLFKAKHVPGLDNSIVLFLSWHPAWIRT